VNQDEIVLLENLSICREDETNDVGFARQLASLCDFFVDDAFEIAPRALASNTGIVRWLPTAVAGPWLRQRVHDLKDFFSNPTRPFLAIKRDRIDRHNRAASFSPAQCGSSVYRRTVRLFLHECVGSRNRKGACRAGIQAVHRRPCAAGKKHVEIVLPEDS
jgi:hypothetical protein